MHTNEHSHSCGPSDSSAAMTPSTCKIGDMVRVTFIASNRELDKGNNTLFGRVNKMSQYGAIIGPWDELRRVRLAKPSIYCPDAECVVEEINGESLFEV